MYTRLTRFPYKRGTRDLHLLVVKYRRLTRTRICVDLASTAYLGLGIF